MKKIDEFWLCWECSVAATNNDYTNLDCYYSPEKAAERKKQIEEGLKKLGPNLVYTLTRKAWTDAVMAGITDKGWEDWVEDSKDDDVSLPSPSEFSRSPCDCCGTTIAGHRVRFSTLGEE